MSRDYQKMVLIPSHLVDYFLQKRLETATIHKDPKKVKAMQLYEKMKAILSNPTLSEEEKSLQYADTLQRYLAVLNQYPNKSAEEFSPPSIPFSYQYPNKSAEDFSPPSIPIPYQSTPQIDAHLSPPSLSPLFTPTPSSASEKLVQDDSVSKPSPPEYSSQKQPPSRVEKTEGLRKKKQKSLKSSVFDSFINEHYSPRQASGNKIQTRSQTRENWLRDWVKW